MNTNLIKLVFIFSAFLLSCKPEKEEDTKVPESIITEEQLINILTDAYLAEGASGINVKNVTGNQFDSTYLFNPLKEHQITKSKFDSSMTYYTSHPKKLKLIYDKVLEKLSAYQANGKLQ